MGSNTLNIDYGAIAKAHALHADDVQHFIELCETKDLSQVPPAVNELLDYLRDEPELAEALQDAYYASGRYFPEGKKEEALGIAQIMEEHEVPSEWRGLLARYALTEGYHPDYGNMLVAPGIQTARRAIVEKYGYMKMPPTEVFPKQCTPTSAIHDNASFKV